MRSFSRGSNIDVDNKHSYEGRNTHTTNNIEEKIQGPVFGGGFSEVLASCQWPATSH